MDFMMTGLLSILLSAAALTAPLEKRTYDLAVAGRRVLVGTEAGVVFWEWRGGTLERTGVAGLPDSVNTLTLEGNAVLASVGPEGVYRVDLDSRESRLLVDTKGAAMDALLVEGTLVVAEGTLGIGYYRDGAETARVPTAGHCRGMAVMGKTVLAACGTDGVFRLDGQGKVLGRLETHAEARRLSVEGTRCAVALGKSGTDIYDLKDAAKPILLTHIDSPDGAHDAELSGGLLYTADGKAGFHIYDLEGKAGTAALTAIPTVYMANRIRPLDGKLYLAEDGGGFRVMEWKKGAAVQFHPKEKAKP
jgi:hypothetical protein